MKIAILVLSIGSFGNKGFYNLQEVGLAKALGKLQDEVVVYKLVDKNKNYSSELINGTINCKISYIPSQKIGTNGIIDCKYLDKNIDALICFSDTQLFFPRVYRWAKKNKVFLLPYIGVVKSHSTNIINRLIINTIFMRNLRLYKKCTCCVKTPMVKEQLSNKKVDKIYITPVGLDLDLLNNNIEISNIKWKIKEKYGYKENEKIVLFVGRLIDEKNPLQMLEILYDLRKMDSNYKLIMVGCGVLKQKVEQKIKDLKLSNHVRLIEQIPNNEMWQLYNLADVLVNLNKQEIFGMVLLEAMYYNCKIVAYKAPGPNYIIKNSINGYLANTKQEIISYILNGQMKETQRFVKDNFTWESTAKKISDILSSID